MNLCCLKRNRLPFLYLFLQESDMNMNKKTNSLLFYFLMLIFFGSLMYWITVKGESMQISQSPDSLDQAGAIQNSFSFFQETLMHHIQSPIGMLLLQIIAILLVCRLFGWIFKKIGQPTVIGEIVAGIVLGPSVVGNWFPEFSSFLFPADSLGNITLLSQFGLILFMFAIGMELDMAEVRKRLKETILISHTCTVMPFFFGMLTAYYVYENYAYEGTPFLPFALFIGIAMSITAFPILARIIQEKGLTKSHLGVVTLASAANGDLTAWCLLAVVIAVAQAGSMLSSIYNILFSILYLVIMFLVIRPFLRMIGNIYHNKEVIDKPLVAFMFLLLIVSSYLTEILGLHALFGAFMAGVIMPSNIKFRKIMTEKVEDVSLSLFLPLFFVSTGLRTEIGLLNSPELWWLCGLFIIVAIVGKFGGALISARVVGESWKDSLYIGALMNTRGLMELIVLTIGYEMKILPPSIFVILVLMTLVTTFMTSPLVSFINYCFKIVERRKEKLRYENIPAEKLFKVLLSFGRAGSGQVMLDVAYQMFGRGENKLDVTALHLTVGSDVNPLHTDKFEEISFGPILYGAKKLNMQIHPRYEVSNNAGQDICDMVNDEGFNFLLVGAGISYSDLPEDIEANQYRNSNYLKHLKNAGAWFYPGSLLKDKTKTFINRSLCDVGVFINRKFTRVSNLLIVISGTEDLFLLDYALSLINTTHASARILNRMIRTTPGYQQEVERLQLFADKHVDIDMLPESDFSMDIFQGYNFMLISYTTWNDISESYKEALQTMPSTLIIHKYQP